jgi:hypothetical protein
MRHRRTEVYQTIAEEHLVPRPDDPGSEMMTTSSAGIALTLDCACIAPALRAGRRPYRPNENTTRAIRWGCLRLRQDDVAAAPVL